MPGIWISAMRQPVSATRGDARKSAADGKTSTRYPSDRMSLRMDSRKNWSSSTIETNDAVGTCPPAVHANPPYGPPDNAIAPARQFTKVRQECRWGNARTDKLWLRRAPKQHKPRREWRRCGYHGT